MLEVKKVLEDFKQGRINLTPSFVEELKMYSDDSVILAVPDVDGHTRMLILTKEKAEELVRSINAEIKKNYDKL